MSWVVSSFPEEIHKLILLRYAYFKKLTYFSTECIYSPDGQFLFSWPTRWTLSWHISAYRGHARVFLKDLEAIRPSAIIDIIHSGESFVLGQVTQRGMKAMREFPSNTPPCFHREKEVAHISQRHAWDAATCLLTIYVKPVHCYKALNQDWIDQHWYVDIQLKIRRSFGADQVASISRKWSSCSDWI